METFPVRADHAKPDLISDLPFQLLCDPVHGPERCPESYRDKAGLELEDREDEIAVTRSTTIIEPKQFDCTQSVSYPQRHDCLEPSPIVRADLVLG